ncbi:hypothetical protein BST97_12320 [Nonlabens spongiae]|uniref:Secretion system C-terminal sorting domain-containing protein n=1 Tax=Nonlabens spongiae TaxID=331648 RepID=A0A1W6MM85_9FLAO|nr:T9SS type A sorting domain-containing protein [Nonlabens spongiae]ARN78714.1 hypothetical protein BST97_12320 [Nonlabens spongiae]
MKKITLILALCSFSMSFAQITFSEDFQGLAPGDPLPAGWALFNVDGNTANANVNPAYSTDAWVVTADQDDANDITIQSTSWYDPPAASDDWVFTPAITPVAGDVLSWTARAQDPTFPDGYEVYVSTAQTTASALGTTPIFSTAAENPANTTRTFDMTPFVGQTVFISWRNISNDQFLLVLDDISVRVPLVADATPVASNIQYSQIPQAQGSPQGTSVEVFNNGDTQVTNAQVTLNVIDQSTSTTVYTETTAAQTIPAESSVVFTPTGFFPAAEGDYTYEFTATIAETDEVPGNDTLTQTLTVSDDIYARDNNTIDGSLGVGAGTAGEFGQQFDITTATTLTSISGLIRNTDLSRDGVVTTFNIYDTFLGVPNVLIATSDPFTINGADVLYTAALPAPGLPLAPGTYIAVVVEDTAVDNITVGTSNEVFTPGTTWAQFTGTPWGNNEDFGFEVSYIIRANFNNVLSIDENGDAAEFKISLYPNPVKDRIYINNSNSARLDSYNIYDTTGKQLLSGDYTEAQGINVENLSSGMYLVQIKGEFGEYSQQFVKE